MNTGSGKFKHTNSYGAGFEPAGIAIAALKRDGKAHQDLIISCYQGVGVLPGNGDGTFGAETIYSTGGIGVGPRDAVVADFNGDGNPDIAAGLFNGNSALLYGRGDGTFRNAIPIKIKTGEVESLVAGDFANHQAPDLAIPGSAGNSVAVLINSR